MSQLSLNFLGTFQVILNEKPITQFRSTNVQGLLVYLALQIERPLNRDVLATLFWPDEPDDVARANLRQTIYQLRKLLGDTEKGALPYLLVTRQTVQFNTDSPTICDIHQFLSALEDEDLATAVSLYSGELLPGFATGSIEFEDWIYQRREHLHKMAIDALHRLTQQLMGTGDYTQAERFARQQIQLEPWREAGHRQLMQILVLNGERSKAMAQYEQCKNDLWQELGVEPSPQTTALYEQIVAGEPIFIETQSIQTAVSQPATYPHNLTVQLTPFFNRDAEQAFLLERITQPENRLICLLGEGGIGKSRLAQELAWQLREQFPDGTWFVSLAGLTAVSDSGKLQETIATAIAQTIHCPLSGNRSPITQLLSFLRDRHALLILDNFEHIMAGADIIMAILQAATKATILSTSREPLNFSGELVYPLERLHSPAQPTTRLPQPASDDLSNYPAVQLFVDRAERANGRFALTADNQNDVAQLCHLIAGLPLGLELAAASLRYWSVPQLIAAIRDSLDNLATTRRDIPERHRSMRAVFTTSWELLDAHDQRTFAALSIFQQGFSAHAARSITHADLFQLQIFIDKSILQKSGDRFVMHELLRQFAAEKRREFPNAAVLEHTHSNYYLDFVASQSAAIVGQTPQVAAKKIAADLDNIRRAWQTAVSSQEHIPQLLACAPTLAEFYQIRGLYREGEQLFAQAITQLHTDLPAAATAHLLSQQASMSVRLSRYDAAITQIKEALTLIDGLDEPWLDSRLHVIWGEATWRQGAFDESEQHLQHALHIANEIDDPDLQAITQFHLGIVYDYRQEHELALSFLEKALVIWQQLGNRRRQGFTLNSIGVVARNLPDHQKARNALDEALQISQENNDLQGQSMALNNLSILATAVSDYEDAQQYLQDALQLANFTGDEHAQALLIYNLGWNAHEAGWQDEAAQFAQQSRQIRHKIGDQRGEMRSLLLLANLEQENGRIPQARIHYQSALQLSQQVSDPQSESEIQTALRSLP